MLILIIVLLAIGFVLFIFFAKRTDSTSDSLDHSPHYYSNISPCESSRNDDSGYSDHCHSNDDSSSDSSGCDSSSND
ncbi:hypothetical protein QSV37_08850 [Acinetobacter sp. VNK23]|nr:hypothetical protein [Acinetobacter thutiue]MDM1020409.1 hypothetical protein [Acinetobacter thutiue]